MKKEEIRKLRKPENKFDKLMMWNQIEVKRLIKKLDKEFYKEFSGFLVRILKRYPSLEDDDYGSLRNLIINKIEKLKSEEKRR